MAVNLKGRHFLSMTDFSREEILAVLETARKLKAESARAEARGSDPVRKADHAPVSPPLKRGEASTPHPPLIGGEVSTPLNPPLERGEASRVRGPNESLPLAGKTLAMIFQKPSLRTRVSFETGMTRLGGHAIYLAPTDISLGQRETTEDIALVLSRYADVIMARVFGHNIVEDLAKYATVPVINGLSDLEHPCQIMADFQTIIERKGRLEGVKGCFIGDGNNVAHSLMLGAARVGMHMTVITPKGYEPKAEVLRKSTEIASSSGSRITVSNDLKAATGADMLYTDVWASMGQEDQAASRKKIFAKYRIDSETFRLADPDAVILHCLPAHYGDEIDYQTSRLPNSAIFDQAENRMHAQNALLVHLAG